MALPIANAGSRQNFAFSALPVASASLSGSGTPGTGGSSITGYAWQIVSQPSGSSGSFSSASVASPTFGALTLQGSVVLFLRVTDNLGAQSLPLGGGLVDDVWTLPPDSAFVVLSVRSEFADLAMPGGGERTVQNAEHAWHVECDDNTGRLDNFVVQDCTDVASATTTGPNLDRLTDGSYATDDGLSSGVALHLHAGDSMDPATTTTIGAVKLEATAATPSTPVVVNRDRVGFSYSVSGKIAQQPGAGNPSWGLAACIVPEDLYLTDVAYTLKDGGTSTRASYTFGVYHLTAANFGSNTFGAALVTKALAAPGTSNIAQSDTIRVPPELIADGEVAVFRVNSADADVADQGSNFNCTFYFQRRV